MPDFLRDLASYINENRPIFILSPIFLFVGIWGLAKREIHISWHGREAWIDGRCGALLSLFYVICAVTPFLNLSVGFWLMAFTLLTTIVA